MFSMASSSVHAGFGDGGSERVEVHADQVDGRDAVGVDGGHVLGQVAAGQDAAMHLRVQGLDAAVEHFREAGVVADFGDGQAGVAPASWRCRRWTAA